MNQRGEKVRTFGQTVVLYAKRYAFVLFYWLVKIVKIQQQKLLQKHAARKLEKAYSEFGAMVYKEFVNGNANWQDSPDAQDKLDKVKLAEADVEQYNQRVEEINKEFEDKKNEIKEKLANVEKSSGEESNQASSDASPSESE